MHRLRAAGTEIDDREPALTQGDTALRLHPDCTGIGAAVPQDLGHRLPDRAQRVGRRRRAPVHHAGNAAHRENPEPHRA